MKKGKYKFSNTEINEILYSGIRNSLHHKIRRNGFIRKILKNSYILLLGHSNRCSHSNFQSSILNDAPQKDWVPSDSSWKVINFNENNKEIRPLLFIEMVLLISFLLNLKSIQNILFNFAQNKTLNFIKKKNIEHLICGHPTILMTFISFFLSKLGKKVITLQHGIYNLNEYKVLWFEKEIATHIIVYGQYFKNLYQSQGVSEEKLIIGNPYFKSDIGSKEVSKIRFEQNKCKKAVFIGQQFYKVLPEVKEPYNKSISNLADFLMRKNISVYYKPHPRERIKESLTKENISRLNFFLEKKDSDLSFDDFDLYYSVNSTLLVETYLQKKKCFQIHVPYHFKLDNFCNYTGIPLINSNNLDNHLGKDFYNFYYDMQYLNVSRTPRDSIIKKLKKLLVV